MKCHKLRSGSRLSKSKMVIIKNLLLHRRGQPHVVAQKAFNPIFFYHWRSSGFLWQCERLGGAPNAARVRRGHLAI